jgi:hypothetical protein
MTSYNIENTHHHLEDKSKFLNNICYINVDNHIILNYEYFKYFGNSQKYNILIGHIIEVFNVCLTYTPTLTVHLYIKSITLTEIEKKLHFIKIFAETLKQQFPDKLKNCFVYDSSFLFSQIYNIISIFIDKDTKKKIHIIPKHK